MERFAGLKFSQIKNCDVVDKEGDKIGRLLDAVFRNENNKLSLTKFTVGGSRLEELLEDMRLRDDIDPVFPIDSIEGVSPSRIRLSVGKENIPSTTTHEGAIESDEIKLSSLSKFKILDHDNVQIGNIIDLKFTSDNAEFIIGDGFMLELLEDAGLREDVDLLVSSGYIEHIGDNRIVLNQSKVELEETFGDHITSFKRIDINPDVDRAGGPQRKTYYFPRGQF